MNLDGHRSLKFYEIQEKDVQLNALSKPKCTLYCDWIVRKQMTQLLIDREDLSLESCCQFEKQNRLHKRAIKIDQHHRHHHDPAHEIDLFLPPSCEK